MMKKKGVLTVWAMACVGLCLSIFASLWVKQRLEDGAMKQFAHQCDQVVLKIEERLGAYALILRGGAGLFAASAGVDRQAWRAYVETQRASEIVPGVQGIGFAEVIAPYRLAEHIARVRGEGFPDYSVRPPGERPVTTAIIYLEPFRDRNLRAFGYDMWSEPVRRAAMEYARDSGEATLSGKVELVQETSQDVQAGTLMYVPVYRNAAALDTLERRRAALIGWAYSPFRMNDLMSGILSGWSDYEGSGTDLKIYAGRVASSSGLLFDSHTFRPDSHPSHSPGLSSPLFQRRSLDFNGTEWLLEFDEVAGGAGINYAAAWAVLFAGLVLTTLLVSLLSRSFNTLLEESLLRERDTAKLGSDINQLNLRLTLAADSARIGVWDYFVPENKLIWDKWMYALYGVREENFCGAYEAWRSGLHPDDRARGDEEITLALRGEKEFDSEFRVLWPTGEVRYIKANAVVVRDADGTPLRMTGVNYDITERRLNDLALQQRESLLRENKAQLRLLLDSTAEAIYGIDLDGKCTFCNPACLKILGYTRVDELIGKNMHDLIHSRHADGSDFPVEDCRIFLAFQDTATSHVDDEVLWRADGTCFSAEYWSYPQLVDDKPVGAVVSFVDITERKRNEAELLHAKAMAESASSAKSMFLSTMSHEIRTPINGVIGMMTLLLDSGLSREQREFAEMAHMSAVNLLGLINDILDFSKIEAGKLEIDVHDFDLQTMLEDTVDLLALRAGAAGLELICRIDPDVPLLLRGDSRRLRQVINNLAGNAIKFTPEGEVLISVMLESDSDAAVTLRFEVRDSGIGIPADRQAALFTPFTQADGSTTRKYGGTGLGLAISKQLTELLGGEIGLDSEEDKGSTFWFTARFEKQLGARLDVPGGQAMAARSARILVVDDSATNLQLLAELLQRQAYPLETAGDAESALRLLREAASGNTPFDVVVLDQQMPGIDGRELARRIKADPLLAPTRLVLMTPVGQRNEGLSLERIGFAGTLSKPVRGSQLGNCVAMALSASVGAANEAGADTATPPAVAEAVGCGVRILLAEDNVVNQKFAQTLLSKLGYQIDVVTDGRQAILALERVAYDLVLMDCQMPVMDGFEATARIRDTSSKVLDHGVPVIAMTANAMAGDREKCLAAGMTDYLAKPVDSQELCAKLVQIHGRKHGRPVPAARPPVDGETTAEEAVLDTALALSMMGGERSMLLAMLAIVRDQILADRREIAHAAGDADAGRLKAVSHRLKGSVGQVGAVRVQKVCALIEAAATCGDLAAVADLQRTLEAELDALIPAIHDYLGNRGTSNNR